MQISKTNNQLTENFKESEFYSGSFDAPDSHFLHDSIPLISQYLRTFLSSPVSVNSTFRTSKHNLIVGGSSNSQHLKGNAVDLSFTDGAHIILTFDILNKGELFQTLLKMGVRGIGLYDTFIHFDFRSSLGKQKFDNFNFAFWDNRIKKKEGIDVANLIKGENKRYVFIPLLALFSVFLLKKLTS